MDAEWPADAYGVARVERSETRGNPGHGNAHPGCASRNPGYASLPEYFSSFAQASAPNLPFHSS